MQTLATSLGSSVGCKTVTFTPSTANTDATLRIGDGECVDEIYPITVVDEEADEATYHLEGDIIFIDKNGVSTELTKYPLSSKQEQIDLLRVILKFAKPLGIIKLR